MKLPVGWAIFLLLVAAWNLFVWPQFLRRVINDERARDTDGRSTAFLRVHAVLISVSLVAAFGVGLLGILTIL